MDTANLRGMKTDWWEIMRTGLDHETWEWKWVGDVKYWGRYQQIWTGEFNDN